MMSSQRPASPSGSQLQEKTLGSDSASNTAGCDQSEAQTAVDTASSVGQEMVKAMQLMQENRGKEELDKRNLPEGKPEAPYPFNQMRKEIREAIHQLNSARLDLPWLPIFPKPRVYPSVPQLEEKTPVSDSASNTAGCDQSEAQTTKGTASSAELGVVKATQLMQGDRIYPMVRSPRGKCIIINIMDFEGTYRTRYGSDVDVFRMERLFSDLLFECDVRCNLTAKEMMQVLKAAAKSEEQKDADCLVVVLMSRGGEGIIYGSDCKPLHLHDDIYMLFSNENCPALQRKPKLFFVQACRGSGMDEKGTPITHTPGDGLPFPLFSAPSSARRIVPSFSDMYIAYATTPGHGALRSSIVGSTFISAVYTVFSQHACNMHLEELMHLVFEEVTAQKGKPCVHLYGWTKKLYFNPGINV